MKKALKPEERKIKFTISMNREVYDKIEKNYSNKSKYIENIVYEDLKNKKIINNILL